MKPKFLIGDKVKITEDVNWKYYKGTVGYVTMINSYGNESECLHDYDVRVSDMNGTYTIIANEKHLEKFI